MGRFIGRSLASVVPVLLALVMFAGCAAPEALPAPQRETGNADEAVVVPLRRAGDHLVLPVRVNGGEPRLFMFDTGAAVDAIGVGHAEGLGLEPLGMTDVTGVAGAERVRVFRADDVSVGGASLGRSVFAELDLGAFNWASGAGVGGVLGFRGLAGRAFTLDQDEMTLTVHPAGERPMVAGRWAPLTPFHRLPSILVDLGPGRTVRLIIDTGMDNELMLPREALRRWPQIAAAPVAGRSHATGVGGTVASFTTWVKRLDILGVTLRNVPVTFETPPPGMSAEPPVGRIGNRLLRHFRLTFDPQRRRIHGEWRPLDE